MTSVAKKPRATRSKLSAQEEPARSSRLSPTTERNEDAEKLVKYINDNIIGKNSTFLGPYGRRKAVFCDYNGSGRSLQFLEEYIQRQVLPCHGGATFSTSHSALQSQLYREEARSLVREACQCVGGDRVLLGGGLSRLVRALRLRGPLVFAGPATPATLRPWIDHGATIIPISETREGFLDLNELENKLQQYSSSGKKLVGFFSTASSVTGALADTVATTLVLHQHGALAVWDHSLAAATSPLDMNPELPGMEDGRVVQKDAAYFACDKIVGGVQAPSVVIVKKDMLRKDIFQDECQQESGDEQDDECGTVEAVRAGLVLQLKEAVGAQAIAHRQDHINREVLSHIRNIPELLLVGGGGGGLSQFPLLVRHPRGAFLHHAFVCAVLSDVFGVQARVAAVDHAVESFGIDQQLAREYAKLLGDEISPRYDQPRNWKILNEQSKTNSYEHLRPGYLMISLPYFISESELAFVLEALKMVATEAWKILPQYVLNPETGQWTHRTHSGLLDRRSLNSLSYSEGQMAINDKNPSGQGLFPQTYYECLQAARNLFNSARKSAQRYPLTEQDIKFNARADYLRWYMLPKEAHDLLLGNSTNVKHIVPFDPAIYGSGRKSVAQIHSGSSSPIPGGSPRHFSLSAIDTSQFAMFNSKFRSLSRESSVREQPLIKPQAVRIEKAEPSPVQFALGEMVSSSTLCNTPVQNLIKAENRLSRTRCHSLGSDSPPISISPSTRLSLGINIPHAKGQMDTCNCGSQTDLQSLDDFINSPASSFSYMNKDHASNSDCSQLGRSSPTVSVASQNSEDLHNYVKEMTKEIATEIKSEIREVISRVEDVLENSEPIDVSNMNYSTNHHHHYHGTPNQNQNTDSNSVSISSVAEYLMGVSREMASEVKHEIREMVNQVDEIISPEVSTTGVNFYLSSPGGSRKSSPPEMIRRRFRSDSETSFSIRTKSLPTGNLDDLKETPKTLKKSPTSPVFTLPGDSSPQTSDADKASPVFFRAQQKIGQQSGASGPSPQHSPDSLPHDLPCTGSLSFNSSETSSPDTIIQVLSSTAVLSSLPKSLSSHKLSDEDNSCTESECQQLYCKNKTWYHKNSLSSQDSGINMSFQEHEGYHDLVKRRPSSDSSCYKRKRNPSRLKSSNPMQRQEKSEVPDIIEGVPVCSDDYRTHYNRNDSVEQKTSPTCRHDYEHHGECDCRNDSRSSCATSDSLGPQRNSRTSTASSLDSTDFSRKSSFNTDSFSSKKSSMNTTSSDDYARCSDHSCCQLLDSVADMTTAGIHSRLSSASSSDTEYPGDFVFDEDGKWHCPPKSVWKGTVEAVQEFSMIRHQDKVLVCLSGGAHSLTLLHTLHQYQFYARAKGIHFTIGAVTIHDGSSDIDPLHLMAYCKTLGIKYFYEDNVDNIPIPFVSSRKSRDLDLCSFTNHWMRRQIYNAASQHGFNVVATGQHLDDVAQSFIISVFNNGRLRTMKAHYYIRELSLRVIRPFIYVREKSLRQFAEIRRLPTFRSTIRIPENEDASQSSPHDLLTNCVFREAEETRVIFEVDNEETQLAPVREKSVSPTRLVVQNKVNRSLSAPSGNCAPRVGGRVRAASAPSAPPPCSMLAQQESLQPGLFASLKAALHPLISSRNIEKDMKEYRHRKRSVIQMKNGAPVYNSDEGTDEEAVP